jgi:hypothetical protein
MRGQCAGNARSDVMRTDVLVDIFIWSNSGISRSRASGGSSKQNAAAGEKRHAYQRDENCEKAHCGSNFVRSAGDGAGQNVGETISKHE